MTYVPSAAMLAHLSEFECARVSVEQSEETLSGSSLSETCSMIVNQTIVVELTSVLLDETTADCRLAAVVQLSTPRDEYVHDIRPAFECDMFAAYVFEDDQLARQFLAHLVTFVDISV